MAALPYMPFYPSDYFADAHHLTTVEHGAYFLLIMTYWARGEPLPDDDKKLARIVKLPVEEWQEIREEIAEFFAVGDGVWSHNRVDRELNKARGKIEQARAAAEASVAARAKRSSSDGSSVRSSGRSTNQNQNQNQNQNHSCSEEQNTARAKKRALGVKDCPDGVDDDVWRDFLEMRRAKKAPLTGTALARIASQAEKAGWSLSNALAECVERGWQGFKAEWVKGRGNGNGGKPSGWRER